MPCTPIAESASRTSSSLNGLMIAVTSFMSFSSSEAVRDERDQALLAPVLAFEGVERALRIGALHVRAGVEALAEVVGGTQLPHRVREVVVVHAGRGGALVALVPEDAVQGELVHERVIDGKLEVVGA